MPIQMYALVNAKDSTKVTESHETTHLNNGTEAWVPIVYNDKPETNATQVAERTEGLIGAQWVKSWTIREKTDGELRRDRIEAIKKDEETERRKVLDVLLAILDDDQAKKSQARSRIRGIVDRRDAEE